MEVGRRANVRCPEHSLANRSGIAVAKTLAFDQQ